MTTMLRIISVTLLREHMNREYQHLFSDRDFAVRSPDLIMSAEAAGAESEMKKSTRILRNKL